MNDGPDVLVLLLGVVLTFVIGSLLLRAGRPYLEQVFPEPHVAKGVDRLLTVLFLLVTLGFLALMTTADFGIDGVYERVMVKLGLVLLTIGTTYGLMMFVVSQIRARRRQEQISDEISAQLAHQHAATADQQQPAQQMAPAQQQMPQQMAPAQQQMPSGQGLASQDVPGEVPPGMAPAQVPEEPPAGGYAPQQPAPQYQQPAPQYQQPAPQQHPQPAPQQHPQPAPQQPAPQFQEPYQEQPPTLRR